LKKVLMEAIEKGYDDRRGKSVIETSKGRCEGIVSGG
jgi:hypothetical protein